MFYSFHTFDKIDTTPTAFIDSSACSSEVGKETLDQDMKDLGISELEDKTICQPEYQFGTSNNSLKSICAVHVTFLCRVPKDGQTVTSKIRFDVFEGRLPFLIGLPSLLAI